jgi:hypothetical protein
MGRSQSLNANTDERELQFDVRALDAGDGVEVFVEAERRWVRGQLRISTSGLALVQFASKPPVRLEEALAMGIKRVLH